MPRLFDQRFQDHGNPPMVAPEAVATEGNRILESIAAGTYGSQPQRETPAGGGGVTPTASDTDPTGRFGTSFFNQPSLWQQNRDPAQLRQDLRLEELTTRAAAGKFALEEAQRRAPVLEDLNVAKLAHQEAATRAIATHEKTLLEHDTAGFNATHNFLADLHAPGAPSPGDPAYANFFKSVLVKNGDIVHSKGGRELIRVLGEKHDAATSVADLASQLPPGYTPTSIEVGGGKQTHITAKPPAIDKAHAVTVGNVDSKGNFKGDNKGTHVKLTYSDGNTKDKILSIDEYKQLGGQFSPETAKARGGEDLIALANKALVDPNASPAQKAAAQKWLNEHAK